MKKKSNRRKRVHAEEKLKNAFSLIAWYNGHYKWLWWLSDELRKNHKEGNYPNPFPCCRWETEEHTLWMFLVGAFGGYGTSINSGWIEDRIACANFIDEVTERYDDDLYDEDDDDREPLLPWKLDEDEDKLNLKEEEWKPRKKEIPKTKSARKKRSKY